MAKLKQILKSRAAGCHGDVYPAFLLACLCGKDLFVKSRKPCAAFR